MKLIVGLGNPGRSYSSHRHNVGFCVVDILAKRLGIDVEKRSFGALIGKGKMDGEDVILAKPQTFMNLSGDAAGPLLRYYKLDTDDLIVVHDDVDIDFGNLKIAKGAGHGGHNGVRSIAEALGDKGFYRIRMGVGRPQGCIDTADYVLQSFTGEERVTADSMITEAADAVEALLKEGLEKAQTKYH